METKLPFTSKRDSIKDYDKSVIAKSETNDCVVRAMASSFDISYDDSHKFCKEVFNRENRKGVSAFGLKMNGLIRHNININNKKIILVGSYNDLYYNVKVKGNIIKRKLTVGKFVKDNPEGTYIAQITGHAFTIKNGTIIGNVEDAQKIKKQLLSIWKVV